MSGNPYELVAVLGHTAGGKTAFAAQLADRIGGEVISADSRQVYRRMDIGTGKDYSDYLVSGRRVPVHLIDIADAGEEYNLFRFRKDFMDAYRDVRERGPVPVMCGGSGLYIESVLRDYRLVHVPVDASLRRDLEQKSREELEKMLESFGPLHNTTDTSDGDRLIRAIEIASYRGKMEELPSVSLHALVLGIRFDRYTRRKRITRRLKSRLESGMVEEARALISSGVPPEKLEYYGLEYRYLSRYIRGLISYDEMFSQLNTAIHRFAKRQMTYFRGMERRGVSIHWLEGKWPLEEKLQRALDLYGEESGRST